MSKIKYSPDEDILLYEVSSEPIDYAEESGSVIVHFTKEGRPVLLEIMDASKFLAETARAREGDGMSHDRHGRQTEKLLGQVEMSGARSGLVRRRYETLRH